VRGYVLDAEKKHFSSIRNTFHFPVTQRLPGIWITEETVYLFMWRENECLTSPESAG